MARLCDESFDRHDELERYDARYETKLAAHIAGRWVGGQDAIWAACGRINAVCNEFKKAGDDAALVGAEECLRALRVMAELIHPDFEKLQDGRGH